MSSTETATIIDQEFFPGDTPWFEYHCWESHESMDAQVWYRSHQKATVLEMTPYDGVGLTREERIECAQPFTYRVRFEDGLEWDVFEDELTKTKDGWNRKEPPKGPVAE